MRMISKTSIVAAVTALTIFSSVFSANAQPWPHHGWGHGYWAPGVGIGLLGAAIVGATVANSCYAQEPVYDRYGNFVGYRSVYTCY
jgi:hypothetical protein